MSEELRPCPFCGRDAATNIQRRWADDDEIITHGVNCCWCNAQLGGSPFGGYQTEELAVAAWNRRAAASEGRAADEEAAA